MLDFHSACKVDRAMINMRSPRAPDRHRPFLDEPPTRGRLLSAGLLRGLSQPCEGANRRRDGRDRAIARV